MIVYDGLKTDFLTSCENDSIAIQIEENILSKLGRHTPKSEFRSWENSLNYMYKVLNDDEFKTWQVLKSNEYLGKTCVNSEYEINFKIGEFWIGGRLDALVKDGNEYYILDYKTGSIPKNPVYDYQTMTYLLGVKKLFKDADKITFVYIDLKQNKNHTTQLTPELEKEYLEKTENMCKTIDSTKDFKKTNCKYCEYSKIC